MSLRDRSERNCTQSLCSLASVQVQASTRLRVPLGLLVSIRRVNTVAVLVGWSMIGVTQLAPQGAAWGVCVGLLTFSCWQLHLLGTSVKALRGVARLQPGIANPGTRSGREADYCCSVVSSDPHVLLQLRDVPPTLGEPAVFRYSSFVPSWGAAIALFAPLVINARFLERNFPLNMVVGTQGELAVWVFLALTGLLLGGTLLGPNTVAETCLRLVPGQLDKMVGHPYSTRWRVTRKTALTNTCVHVDGTIVHVT